MLCLIFIVLLYLLVPTVFFRSWMNVLFSSSVHLLKTIPQDLLSKELILYGGLIVLMRIKLGMIVMRFRIRTSKRLTHRTKLTP
jgi:hypothetical protein